MPETRSRAATCSCVRPGEVLAGLVELALALEELAIALLEHVGCADRAARRAGEPALQAGELVAPGAGLFLGFALQAELLVLGLEDELLLAGPGLGFDAARLGLRRLHRLGCPRCCARVRRVRLRRRRPRRPPPRGPMCPSVSSHPDRIDVGRRSRSSSVASSARRGRLTGPPWRWDSSVGRDRRRSGAKRRSRRWFRLPRSLGPRPEGQPSGAGAQRSRRSVDGPGIPERDSSARRRGATEPAARSVETVVIGAGQAGLMMSWHLAARRPRARRARASGDAGRRLAGPLGRVPASCRPNWTTGLPGLRLRGRRPRRYMRRDEVAGRDRRAMPTSSGRRSSSGPTVGRLDGRRRGPRPSASRPTEDRSWRRRRRRGDGRASTRRGSRRPRGFAPRVHQVHAHDYRTPGGAAARRRARRRDRADRRPARRGAAGGGSRGGACRSVTAGGPRAGIAVTTSSGGCASSSTRGRSSARRLPTGRPLPDPRLALRLQPAPLGPRRRPRHEPAPVRAETASDSSDGSRARTASAYVRAGPRPPTSGSPTSSSTSGTEPSWDTFAERAGSTLPPDDREPADFEPPEVTESTSRPPGSRRCSGRPATPRTTAGSTSPVLGEFGLPRHVRGISDVPGLTFLGLLWQHNQGSANLLGVATDAEYLVSRW